MEDFVENPSIRKEYIDDPTVGSKYLDTSGRIVNQILTLRNPVDPILKEFNFFAKVGIVSFLTSYESKLSDESRVVFENVVNEKPSMKMKDGSVVKLFPRTAVDYGLDYVFTIHMDVVHQQLNSETGKWEEVDRKENVKLGEIPAMVGSVVCNLHGLTDDDKVERGECPSDYGGYFVVGGSEKIVSSYDTIRPNRISFSYKEGEYKASMTSWSTRGTTQRKLKMKKNNIIMLVLASCARSNLGKFPELNIFVLLSVIAEFYGGKQLSDEGARYDWIISNILKFVPKKYRNFINAKLKPTLENAKSVDNHVDHIIEMLGAQGSAVMNGGDKEIRKLSRGERIKLINGRLVGEAFSHLDQKDNTIKSKYDLFSFMIARFMMVVTGKADTLDMDDWGNKFVVTPGRLFYMKFMELMMAIIKFAQENAQKGGRSFNTFVLNLKSKDENRTSKLNLQKHFGNALKTEKWNMYGKLKDGMVKTLTRKSALDPPSVIRKIVTQVKKHSKSFKIRAIHHSQLYAICLAETPEGEKCGLNKHLALLATITNDSPDKEIIEYLADNKLVETDDRKYDDNKHTHICYINGDVIGKCDGKVVRRKLLEKRREGKFSMEMSVVIDQYGDLNISTDAGRIMFPVFIVDKVRRKPLFEIEGMDIHTATWEEMLARGVVEYIDVFEASQRDIRIASSLADFYGFTESLSMQEEELGEDPENKDLSRTVNEMKNYAMFSHISIHPAAVFGVSGTYIPLANHNHAPKMSHQCNHSRQAMGLHMGNKVKGNVLAMAGPTVPLVQTSIYKQLGYSDNPMGRNVTMAIKADPSAQEDAIVMNRNIVDYGGFNYISTRVITVAKEKQTDFEYPEDIPERRKHLYHALNTETGFPMAGSYVKPGDILIGQVKLGMGKKIDISEKTPKDAEGTITDVIISNNFSNQQTITVKIQKLHKPEVGDKFSTRQAQKSTIGKIEDPDKMPYAIKKFKKDNFVLKIINGKPTIVRKKVEKTSVTTIDIILSVHALPSRMTIATLIELLLGKVSAFKGETFDATTYRFDIKRHLDEVVTYLKSFGMSHLEDDAMISGETGEPLHYRVFSGIMFEQQLKHIAKEKIKARGIGPKVDPITRQPHSGKDGGVKLGEMEKDALLAHMVPYAMLDAFSRRGGQYPVPVCKRCRTFTTVVKVAGIGEKKSYYECRVCNRHDKSSEIVGLVIPYVLKTFIFYMNGMGIDIKLNVRVD